MPQYDNELHGVLFKNDKKTSDKHPDYKGQAQVRGEEFWLSAWINTKQNSNEKYMKLSLEPKDQAPGQSVRADVDVPQVQVPMVDDSDDVPF